MGFLEMSVDLDEPCTQRAFAQIIGASAPAINIMLKDGVIKKGDSAGQWLLDYCARLREKAAGRATDGTMSLAAERAKLAKEQTAIAAIKRAEMDGDLAPVQLLTWTLSRVSTQLAAALERIPVEVQRQSHGAVSPDAILIVETEIAKAREIAADIAVDFGEAPGTAHAENEAA